MIRPNEIRTTMTAAAIVIIAATTVMISTIAIRIAIGIEIGTKTAIASIRTETVIVTMMRITTAIIASTAADLMAEIANGAVACRRRIRADLTAITRAGSDIAEVTIKARPRAWTDACGTFTRITGFQTTFPLNDVASPGAGQIVAYQSKNASGSREVQRNLDLFFCAFPM